VFRMPAMVMKRFVCRFVEISSSLGRWRRAHPAASPSKISGSAPFWMRCSGGSPERRSSALRRVHDENGRYYVLTVLRGGYQNGDSEEDRLTARTCRLPHANFRSERSATFGYSPGGLATSDSAAGECSRHAFQWRCLVSACDSNRKDRHDDYKLDCKSRRSA